MSEKQQSLSTAKYTGLYSTDIGQQYQQWMTGGLGGLALRGVRQAMNWEYSVTVWEVKGAGKRVVTFGGRV